MMSLLQVVMPTAMGPTSHGSVQQWRKDSKQRISVDNDGEQMQCSSYLGSVTWLAVGWAFNVLNRRDIQFKT